LKVEAQKLLRKDLLNPRQLAGQLLAGQHVSLVPHDPDFFNIVEDYTPGEHVRVSNIQLGNVLPCFFVDVSLVSEPDPLIDEHRPRVNDFEDLIDVLLLPVRVDHHLEVAIRQLEEVLQVASLGKVDVFLLDGNFKQRLARILEPRHFSNVLRAFEGSQQRFVNVEDQERLFLMRGELEQAAHEAELRIAEPRVQLRADFEWNPPAFLRETIVLLE